MTSLVHQRLLLRTDGADGEPRFGMLETIRDYALERLAAHGEEVEYRRHAEWLLRFVEASERLVPRPDRW